MKQAEFNARIWLITDAAGNLIDDIDTDMIYHNAHLAVTDIHQMGQYTFGNLEGWKDFPRKARPGDIVLCGKNFGAGSSRQHAVDCFKSLGITAIIAESFGAIYKRNAINAGFPILTCPDLSTLLKGIPLQNEQPVTLNVVEGLLFDGERNLLLKTLPMSRVQKEIYEAGDLFAFARNMK